MAVEPSKAITRVELVNTKHEKCPPGTTVLVWGPIGKPPYLVERSVEDPALARRPRYEFFEADEDELDFIQ